MEIAELKEALYRCGALKDKDISEVNPEDLSLDRLLEDPILTNAIVVDALHLLPRNVRPDAIISPAEDRLFGFATAMAAWSRFYYADKTAEGYELRHGFSINRKIPCMIVVPIVSDMDQINALLAIARERETNIIGVMCLCSSLKDTALDVPLYHLL